MPYRNNYEQNKSVQEEYDVYEHLYSQDKPIHTTVYRNGDPFDSGVPVIVTRTQFKNWLNFLDYLTERLNLAEGAVHNVYTLRGEEVRHFQHLKQHGVYVGAHGEFKEADYGGKDTRRTKWQVRHASAKADPSAVMSKESRELYLEQKGFKPIMDDVWDDPNFDTKGVSPKHHSVKRQEAPRNNNLYYSQPNKTKNVKSNATSPTRQPNGSRQQAPNYMKSTKSISANKSELRDNAYRISDKGKAAPATTTKSRFPPIHTGSLVEMNKSSKNVKANGKTWTKTRSSSAPENLHNKNLKAKKTEMTTSRSSKSITSEPKNFNSQIKKTTTKSTTTTTTAAKAENKNSLKPPGGKSTVVKPSTNAKAKKELQRVNSPSTKSVGNKSLSVRQSRSRSPSQNSYRERTPATSSNRKRNKSADYDAQSHYSTRHRTPRAASLDNEYYDKDRSYKNDEYEDEYYREEENEERRRNSYYENEYDKKNDEYDEYDSSRRRNESNRRNSSYRDRDDEERLYEDNMRKDDYDDYRDRDYYREENGYEEEEGYYREPTPKPVAKNNKKQSEQQKQANAVTSTGTKQTSNREQTPQWANKLHVAVRDLATEVHNLADNQNS